MEKKINIDLSLFFLVIFFWLSFFYSILISSFRVIPSPISEYQKNLISFFFPEGWGFFTKSPREDELLEIFKIEKSKLIPVTISNTCPENLMGFSKKSRYIGAELGKVSFFIGKENWILIKGWSVNDKLPSQKFKLAIPHLISSQLLYFPKGEYLVVKHTTIPWAWATRNQENFHSYKIKRIII
jgi:antimicrobial peptide system SdpA family protein